MGRLLAVAALMLVAACGSDGSSDPGEARATTERSGAASTTAPSSTPAPGGAKQSGPAAAVEAMMRALDAGDCRAVRRVVVTPSAVDCGVVSTAKDTFADEGIDLDEVSYSTGPVNGSSSTVTISWGNDFPDESYEVEKVGDRWQVVFDSAA